MVNLQRCRAALLVAPDERTVRALLRDCISELGPDEIAALPPACAAVLLARDPGIHDAALELLRADLTYRGDPEVGAMLGQIAHAFASASVRLAQIHAREVPAE